MVTGVLFFQSFGGVFTHTSFLTENNLFKALEIFTMFLTIDDKLKLRIDIGDKKPTPKLIAHLREKYNVDKAYISQIDGVRNYVPLRKHRRKKA